MGLEALRRSAPKRQTDPGAGGGRLPGPMRTIASPVGHWPLHPPPGRQSYAHHHTRRGRERGGARLTVRDSRLGTATTIPRERCALRGMKVDGLSAIPTSGSTAASRPANGTNSSTPHASAGGRDRARARATASAGWRMRRRQKSGGRAAWISRTATAVAVRRFLRQFVYDGLNLDEQGRQVFDGLSPSGRARRGGIQPALRQLRKPPARHRRPVPFRLGCADRPAHGRRMGCCGAARTGRRTQDLHHEHVLRVLARRLLADPHGPDWHRDVEPPPEEAYLSESRHTSMARGCRWSTTPRRSARAGPTPSTSSMQHGCGAFLINWTAGCRRARNRRRAPSRVCLTGRATREAALEQFSACPVWRCSTRLCCRG